MHVCAMFLHRLQENVLSDSFQPLLYYDPDTHELCESPVKIHLHVCISKWAGRKSTIFLMLNCMDQKLLVRVHFAHPL